MVLRTALLPPAGKVVLKVVSPGYQSLSATQFMIGLGPAATMPCLCHRRRVGRGMARVRYGTGFAPGNASALGVTPLLLRALEWRSVLLLMLTASMGCYDTLVWNCVQRWVGLTSPCRDGTLSVWSQS